MTTETLVVGAGVAGLVIARRLALAGERVRVLEASDRVGGQVAPLLLGGVRLDAAAESFATRQGTVAALLDELSLGDEIVTPAAAAWLHRADGVSRPLPATGMLGIPGRPLARDVVAVLGWPGAARAALDALLPARVGRDAVTIGELVRRRMGGRALDVLVSPVLRGVYSRSPEDIAVDPRLRQALHRHRTLSAAVRELRDAAPAGSAVAGLRGGMWQLTEQLTAQCAQLGVTMETGVRVDDLAEGWVASGGVRRPGRVVLAAPDPRAEQRAPRAITLVTVVATAPALDDAPRGSGVLVSPGAPGVRARALTHLTAKWDWVRQAMPGRHAIRLSYDGDPSDAPAQAVADIRLLLGAPVASVDDLSVQRWVRPAHDAGAVTGAWEGTLTVSGETASGIGLAAVVAHAERAAAALLGR